VTVMDGRSNGEAWLKRRAMLLAADHAATQPDSVAADARTTPKTPNSDADMPRWARKPKVS